MNSRFHEKKETRNEVVFIIEEAAHVTMGNHGFSNEGFSPVRGPGPIPQD